MRRIITFLTLALLCVSAAASDENRIRQTVDRYLDARATRDPNLAGKLVARESLDQFEWLRQRALHADRKALCEMSLSQVARVLVIRAKYREFLATIDAGTLAGLGMVDDPFTDNVSREYEVTEVTSNTATAVLAAPPYGGQRPRLTLVRERDDWRIRIDLDGGSADAYEPFWQQVRAEKGCDASLGMALDLIDRKSSTYLLDPPE